MAAMISFYAIKKEGLENAPKGVQDFVDTFFVEKDVFGIPCFVAANCSECKSPWANMNDEEYSDGLSEKELNDCGVFTWLDNHPEIVFQYNWS